MLKTSRPAIFCGLWDVCWTSEEIDRDDEHLSHKPRRTSRHDAPQEESRKRKPGRASHEKRSHSNHQRSNSETANGRSGGEG